jgi:hypothetical protein
MIYSYRLKLFFFDRHTGKSRYPVVEFSRKNWIPAFAGMTGCLLSLLAGAVWGGQDADDASMQARLSGYGGYEFGQIVKGQYAKAPGQRLDHYWTQQSVIQVGGELKRNNGLSMTLIAQGRVSFPYALPTDGSGPGGFAVFSPRYSWDIHHAEAQYSIGHPDEPYVTISAGMFPFKYNRDARTFGDYLLRINPYPQFFMTSFDAPYQRLLGLHVKSAYFPVLPPEVLTIQENLMLTSEIHLWPLRDFSLTGLFNATVLRFMDIGAGIMGHRMFPVDDALTTPKGDGNRFNFSFAGTKVMARLAFDFKRFLPFKELWGKDDWRLYSELCLNGLKDYPVSDTANYLYPGYDDLKKRMPVVFGCTIPVCGFLDVLSVEAEWWDNDFANSYGGVFSEGYALNPNPYNYMIPPDGDRRVDPYGGPWHWSVFLKKTIAKNIRIAAQVGRDHTFIETSFSGVSNIDPEECVDGKGNWGWMSKVEFGF